MPLMSEGKPGPKPAKLRAIWRREKWSRDQTAANAAAKIARGLPVGELLADLLRMQEDTIAGRSVPVGITKEAWVATCAEMNEGPTMCEFCGSVGVCIVCEHDHGRKYRVICTQARKAGAIGVFGAVDVVVNAASANAAKEVFAEKYERRGPLMVFRK